MQICAHLLLPFVILEVMSFFWRVLIRLKEASVRGQINNPYCTILLLDDMVYDISDKV